MVHVPILGIDIPEPRLSDLIPSTVELLIRALHAAYNYLDDLIRPLSPESKAAYQRLAVAHLPLEIRQARKKIKAEKITDPGKVSSELEDASYAYYRRLLRENVAGFSDEVTEDVCFRKLVDPTSAAQKVWEQYIEEQGAVLSPEQLEERQRQQAEATSSGAQQEQQQWLDSQAAARAQAAAARQAEATAVLPRPARRIVSTGTSGALGLALGVGIVKLVRLLSRQRRRRAVQARAPATAAGLPPRGAKGSKAGIAKGTKAAGSKQRGAGGSKGSGSGRTSPRPPRQT